MIDERVWKTRHGQPIEMRWEEDILDENRGWITHRMQALIDGQEAGYLKTSYIPSCNVARYYPDITHYLAQIRGEWSLVSEDPIERLIAMSYKVELWRNVLKREDVLTMSLQERAERSITYMQKLEEEYGEDFNDFLNYYVDKPYVDYINVEIEFQRRGIGLALYESTAYKLAEKGLRLYGSTLQSDPAKAAWERMTKTPRLSAYIGQETDWQNGNEWVRTYLDLTPLVHERSEERGVAGRAATLKTLGRRA